MSTYLKQCSYIQYLGNVWFTANIFKRSCDKLFLAEQEVLAQNKQNTIFIHFIKFCQVVHDKSFSTQ